MFVYRNATDLCMLVWDFCYCCLEDTCDLVQNLFLALCLGITSGEAQGFIHGARDLNSGMDACTE